MSVFKVTVVIPVYNAEKFVRRAVESALRQRQVEEIILVEDKSPDNALQVCHELIIEYPKVKLYRHPNGANRGAGASRNLGIAKAACDFVAFLDADDQYCDERFATTETRFADSSVVGVYETVGVFFEDEIGKQQFSRMTNRSMEDVSGHITRLRARDYSEVYENLIRGNRGFFNTSGVTIRRSVLSGDNLFNESLRLHQDTELWIRLSYQYKFLEGNSSVVSLRGVHRDNRIVKQNLASKYLYYKTLLTYFRRKPIPYRLKLFLFKSIIRNHPERSFVTSGSRLQKMTELLKYALKEATKFPMP